MISTPPNKILMVDDDPNVLAGFRRTIGRAFKLEYADGGNAALKLLAVSHDFAVIVTDMRMPELNGIEFIARARSLCPDSVYMMLTGNADQQTAIDAINLGQIFRFLSKPCSAELLEAAIRAGIRQYELVTAERVLLRDTLTGSIRLLVEALELSKPAIFAQQACVKHVVVELYTALKLPRDWQITAASSLCLLGLLTEPDLLCAHAASEELLEQCARIGASLLANIPRLSTVAAMVRRQREEGILPSVFDSRDLQTLELVGARVLRFAVDLVFARARTRTQADAVQQLKARQSYDSRLCDAAQTLDALVSVGPRFVTSEIPTTCVQPGMVLVNDVIREGGTLLLARGHTLSPMAIEILLNCAARGLLPERLTVKIDPAIHRIAA